MANDYNFVKFLRGSQAAYNRLASPNINTLYFIYDENSTDTNPSGKLYLGRYLITDGDMSTIALSNLNDVDMGTLTGTEILRYNSTLGKWQPVLASDLLAELNISAGAAVVNSGITKQAGETDADALDRAVLTKKEGDLAIVDGTVYVYDDNAWLRLIDSSVADIGTLADRVDDLEDALDDVYTKAETNAAIAAANHLTYTTVGSLTGIDPTATANQNKIFLVQKSSGAETNNGYNEFMAVNGAWEKLGDWGVNLDNYVQVGDLANYVQTNDSRLLSTTQVSYINNLFDNNGNISIASVSDFDPSNYVLKTTVGDLANLTNRSSANSTIVDELNVLSDRLTWQSIENL